MFLGAMSEVVEGTVERDQFETELLINKNS